MKLCRIPFELGRDCSLRLSCDCTPLHPSWELHFLPLRDGKPEQLRAVPSNPFHPAMFVDCYWLLSPITNCYQPLFKRTEMCTFSVLWASFLTSANEHTSLELVFGSDRIWPKWLFVVGSPWALELTSPSTSMKTNHFHYYHWWYIHQPLINHQSTWN